MCWKILFLERAERKEKERERNTNVWLPLMYPPLGTWPNNPGSYRDWELNQRPFGLQACTQSSELQQSGPECRVLLESHACERNGRRTGQEELTDW